MRIFQGAKVQIGLFGLLVRLKGDLAGLLEPKLLKANQTIDKEWAKKRAG